MSYLLFSFHTTKKIKTDGEYPHLFNIKKIIPHKFFINDEKKEAPNKGFEII